MKPNRKPQHSKPYVPRANVAHVMELRQGNRAQPIPSGKVYKRKPKYSPDYS